GLVSRCLGNDIRFRRSGWVDGHCPLLLSTSPGFRAVEFRGQLSTCIVIQVVDGLLAWWLLRSRFFGSHRSRSGRTFFTLFPFIGIGLLCGFLSRRLLTRDSFCGAALLLVGILVVAGHQNC